MSSGLKLQYLEANSLIRALLKFPSINQLGIEVKLTETWKVMHIPNYPTKMCLGKDEKPKSERKLYKRAEG